MKTFLECVEQIITVTMKTASCIGFLMIGWFVVRLFMPNANEDQLWPIVIASGILTHALDRALVHIGMAIIEIQAEELKATQEQHDDLYEHLKV